MRATYNRDTHTIGQIVLIDPRLWPATDGREWLLQVAQHQRPDFGREAGVHCSVFAAVQTETGRLSSPMRGLTEPEQ